MADGIQLFSCRVSVTQEILVVPSTDYPLIIGSRRSGDVNVAQQFIHGLHHCRTQVHLQAHFTDVAQVTVGIIEAWHHWSTPQIDDMLNETWIELLINADNRRTLTGQGTDYRALRILGVKLPAGVRGIKHVTSSIEAKNI